MTKKKQPEFKVGDFYFTKDGDTKTLWRCATYLGEPHVCMVNLSSSSPPDKTGGVSEFANFRHLIPDPRPAHRPKGSKTRKTEQASTLGAQPVMLGDSNLDETQAQNGALPPAGDTCPPDGEHPTKVDLSTFELRVGGEGRQHKMTLGVGVDTQCAFGKDLKPTLLWLLEQHGITGSDAEVETALVLFPDSPGRNQMIDILKGKKVG